jgi:uncharacterized repeat protein (TIGR03803 family)
MGNFSWWWKACVIIALSAATATVAPAQTFTTLADFDGPDGASPYFVSLAQGPDGSFYGTTGGGGSEGCTNGCGTIFEITSAGALTTFRFARSNGYAPGAGLALATDGNFYGTTSNGGANFGTVFKITPAGTLTTLYNFCSQTNCTDGDSPFDALIQAADGSFYGTAYSGGGSGCPNQLGCGTVFKITSGGSLTTLHNFGGADGAQPYAGLVQADDGNFYGTTLAGGTSLSCSTGCGTVFRIAPGGTFTSLYSFCSQSDCADGYYPQAGLLLGTDGNFYGTTLVGGVNESGTVFRISPGGGLTTLYSFCAQANCSDGRDPSATLVQATDGDFYGTTGAGGANGWGTVFKISSGGTLTTLHSFDLSDGTEPLGGLSQATNGNLYGTTGYGGNLGCFHPQGCGTVYSFDIGLGPFVSFVRNPAKVGQTFGILGQGFAGTTGVSLNGIPANFTVVSDTFMRGAVPAGAATGYVTVTTPSGTLTSNVPFHVIK